MAWRDAYNVSTLSYSRGEQQLTIFSVALWPVSGETRTIILIGFMGSFTTFWAFILESGELLRFAECLYAEGNIVLQTGPGFVALFVGAAAARAI
jgi:fluoride ion exporter CrcB/FEX